MRSLAHLITIFAEVAIALGLASLYYFYTAMHTCKLANYPMDAHPTKYELETNLLPFAPTKPRYQASDTLLGWQAVACLVVKPEPFWRVQRSFRIVAECIHREKGAILLGAPSILSVLPQIFYVATLKTKANSRAVRCTLHSFTVRLDAYAV